MPEYKCELCNFYCQRPGQLKRHIESDRHKANILPIIENELKEMKMQQEELLNRVKLLEDRLQPTKSQQNNNCTVNNVSNFNNTQNNININYFSTTAFGQENWTYISEAEMFKIMGGVNSCIPAIVERLHFDVEHPENHNIKITNKKEPYIKVRKNDKWDQGKCDRTTPIDPLPSTGTILQRAVRIYAQQVAVPLRSAMRSALPRPTVPAQDMCMHFAGPSVTFSVTPLCIGHS